MIISRAPLRLSFLGGGTDFPEYFREHGGAVLATGIDKFSYVTANPFQSHLFDYAIRVSYSSGELARKVDDIRHPVFRECLRFCGLEKDIELHAVADLPAFTGLGSSSSFTVSLLQALRAYQGKYVLPMQLAYEAIHIERHVLKECVGVQDQATAALGGFNVLEFHAEDDIRARPLPLSRARLEEIESHLFIVFTGIKRRAQELEQSKINNLKENTKHLHRLQDLVRVGYDTLTSDASLSKFGELLHQSWEIKQELDNGVSNPQINELYKLGLASGAWGGKLLGAGAGGFLLFCVPPEKQPAIKAAFKDYYSLPVRIAASGSQIIFAS